MRYLLTLTFLAFYFFVSAQNYFMTNGTINTCGGSFQDDNSGGAEGSPYSTSDYTFTICPDNPGDAIQISFAAFNLQTSPNPNNSDRLYIFDGPDDNANSLGSYSGNQLQGLDVTATITNATGCLTFVFVCNTNNTNSFPGWEGLISCETPCATPTAASVISDPQPEGLTQTVGVCMGDPVTFSDNGSFAEAGFNLVEYVWNFDDGTIESGGAEITHTFNEPGEYVVTLTVIDNNGCNSLNLEPLQVLVSTIPIFNTEWESVTCLGEDALLNGDPVQSVTWTALPPQVVAGQTYLADGAGFAYSTSLVFDFFDPNQVLEDCDDLLSILVNMEHSYMGDLEVQLTCPDGTTVIMVGFPENGGGGTFLGEAIDDGSTDPGVGYDYYWDPDATNGTWGENAGGGFGSSLPAGSYESWQDLCAFVGCPLNGEWTLTITDNLAIDNGYIFYWGINFDPVLFPGITTFTPIIGMGADSSYWEGPFIVDSSADGEQISVMPPAVGIYEYTYYATNNFGCTFDTTVTVEIVPGPQVDAGLDMTMCTDAVQLSPEVTVGGNVSDCVFTLEMTDTFGDGWNGHTLQVWVDGNLQESFTLNMGAFQTVNFTLPGGANYQLILTDGAFNTEVEFTLFDPFGNEIFTAGPNGILTNTVLFDSTCGGFGAYIYELSPATGLSNPNSPNPLADVNQTTEYTVTVYPDGYPGCASSDQVTVAIDPGVDPGQDTTMVICFNYGVFNLYDVLGGTPVLGGVWTDSNGNVVDGVFDSFNDAGDVFTYTVDNGLCVAFAQVDITVIPVGDPICCQFSYEINPINVSCIGYTDGQLEIEVFESTEGGPWQIDIFQNNVPVANQTINGAYTFTNLPVGNYTLTILDAGLCITNDIFTIADPAAMVFETVADTLICVDGIAILGAWSDMDPGDWIYTWDNNAGTGDEVGVSPTVETDYTVFATSGDGCISDPMDVTVSVRDSLFVLTVPDTLICQGTIATLNIAGATGGIGGPYSYNWTYLGVPIGDVDSLIYPPAQTATFCVSMEDACETPPVSDCMIVTVEEPIDVLFSADTTAGCVPLELSFTNLIDASLYQDAIWTMGDGSVYGIADPDHAYVLPGLFDVSLTLISHIGCIYNTVYDNYITVYPNPIAGYHADPQPTTVPDTEISFDDYSQGTIVEWYWDFDSLGFSYEQNPVFEFPNSVGGIYPVTLTITDIHNCTDSVVRYVDIDDFYNLFIPNTFTPNADGVNDIFFVQGTDIDPDRFHLWVYDRWGELVFETEDIMDVWVGNFEGGDYYAPDGVYQWRCVVYSITTAKRNEYFGTVNLLR
jgi:gliding motility-associated-like protein